MKEYKLAIAFTILSTITLCSVDYISTKEITSAVLIDKARNAVNLNTNGLHNISVREAFNIDQSEATKNNFLRCSFARPEFRFSWFCHQFKSDGKMTDKSYVALKADQETYFKENVIKSVNYEAQKLIMGAEQLRLGTAMHNLSKIKVTNTKEFNEKFEKSSILAKDVQHFNEKYKALNDVANNEIQEQATEVNGEVGVLKSLQNDGYGMMKAALQLHRINSPVGSAESHSQKKVYASDLDLIMKETEANESKATGVKGEVVVLNNVEQGERELMNAGIQKVVEKNISVSPLRINPIAEMSNISISDIVERFENSNSPKSVSDYNTIDSFKVKIEYSIYERIIAGFFVSIIFTTMIIAIWEITKDIVHLIRKIFPLKRK
jgi:hypothetical protein